MPTPPATTQLSKEQAHYPRKHFPSYQGTVMMDVSDLQFADNLQFADLFFSFSNHVRFQAGFHKAVFQKAAVHVLLCFLRQSVV